MRDSSNSYHRNKESQIPLEVQWKEHPKDFLNNDKSIVRDLELPKEMEVKDSDDPLVFLSRETHRVKKQVQAYVNGLTKNRQQKNNTANADSKNQDLSLETSPKSSKKNMFPIKKLNVHDLYRAEISPPKDKDELLHLQPSSNDQRTKNQDAEDGDNSLNKTRQTKATDVSNLKMMESALSTVGEALPKEISVGAFTALNTDRFTYYSFYARIEELIRYSWENSIKGFIFSLPKSRFQSLNRAWTTELEIWIKPNGEYHSAHLMKSSGIQEFDIAASSSFAQAKMFPNPPREMVRSDGLIKVNYSFIVNYNPYEFQSSNR